MTTVYSIQYMQYTANITEILVAGTLVLMFGYQRKQTTDCIDSFDNQLLRVYQGGLDS